MLTLNPAIAEAAIIFRDFPKAHGGIIQKAVGVALSGHYGGYAETSKRFGFLSGLNVEIDNFFMDRNGKIYLIETKRQHDNVREEGVAARNLFPVADQIIDPARVIWVPAASKPRQPRGWKSGPMQDHPGRINNREVRNRTRRRLRYPIECCYFSCVDQSFLVARNANINMGTQAAPMFVTMPVYAREDLNRIIGNCFGNYLELVDDFIGRTIAEAVPELSIRVERQVEQNPLQTLLPSESGSLMVGEHSELYPSDENLVLGPPEPGL